jgi:hypothetical protein
VPEDQVAREEHAGGGRQQVIAARAPAEAAVLPQRERGAELVFIEAEDADVARIYGRLGFERVGTACIGEAR